MDPEDDLNAEEIKDATPELHETYRNYYKQIFNN